MRYRFRSAIHHHEHSEIVDLPPVAAYNVLMAEDRRRLLAGCSTVPYVPKHAAIFCELCEVLLPEHHIRKHLTRCIYLIGWDKRVSRGRHLPARPVRLRLVLSVGPQLPESIAPSGSRQEPCVAA